MSPRRSAGVTSRGSHGYAHAMDTENTPAVGDLAPDFALADASGNTRRLSEIAADRLVTLIFYRGHW